MIDCALIFGFACVGAAMVLSLFRLAKGPTAADRVLALDTLTINAIALIILFGVWRSTATYFEAAVLFAMVGFVGTVAFCKFVLRGDVIE